ncbi:DUF2177 family protein [Knoellia locipacati]|uniref:Membrane protein n=1 Tax=Knoellia locipacati TaxID=882824 RepID=A0A512SZH6_9MICO|nr:DUF2177 family protein [Knoellia locipacati]GEQ13367.1 membrane protein [Knoellia locipacati]
MGRQLGRLVVVAVAFGVLDGLWLGVIGRPIYDEALGDLLATRPNALAAAAFYVIYVIGITYFVTTPALAEESGRRALVSGALMGFVAYATWDLTNLAVIEGFPASIVAVDLAWGTVATAVASGVTYAVCRRVPALR